jgi:hypothetical protein
MAVTHSGMTTEEFDKIVSDWIATAQHPKFKRRVTECVYQRMIDIREKTTTSTEPMND